MSINDRDVYDLVLLRGSGRALLEQRGSMPSTHTSLSDKKVYTPFLKELLLMDIGSASASNWYFSKVVKQYVDNNCGEFTTLYGDTHN